jgi:hypothetical protein
MSQTTSPADTSTTPEPTETPSAQPSPQQPEPLASTRRPLAPEDLYALRLVEDPRLSPDGATIVYVQQEMDRASYEYRRSLWLIATNGEPDRTIATRAGRPMANASPFCARPRLASSLPTRRSASVASGSRRCG